MESSGHINLEEDYCTRSILEKENQINILNYEQQLLQQKNKYYFSHKKMLWTRISFFALIIISFFILELIGLPKVSVICLTDHVLNTLAPANIFINKNLFWRHFLQITVSLMADISFLLTFMAWIIKGNSGRIFYSLFIYYLIWKFTQQIIIMSSPPGFYWDDPGFPSLIITYGKGNDFFFSWPSGFLFILICENWYNRYVPLSIFCLLSQLLLAAMLLIFRANYTPDIITAIFIGHWIFMVFLWYSNILDNFLRRCFIKLHKMIIANQV